MRGRAYERQKDCIFHTYVFAIGGNVGSAAVFPGADSGTLRGRSSGNQMGKQVGTFAFPGGDAFDGRIFSSDGKVCPLGRAGWKKQ